MPKFSGSKYGTTMIQLSHYGKPLSQNARNSLLISNYKAALLSSLNNQCPGWSKLPDMKLYGVIYWICSKTFNRDSDNISKPAWDALNKTLYKDDKQIRLRAAGIMKYGEEDFTVIDFTNMPTSVATELSLAISNRRDVLYIKLQPLGNHHFGEVLK